MRVSRWPVLVAIVLCVACSGASHRAETTESSQRQSVSVPPSAPSASTHAAGASLECDQDLAAGTSAAHPEKRVLGLISDGWQGQRTTRSTMRVSDGHHKWYFAKTYTYVTKAAAPRTTLALIAPRTARLAYIDGGIWASEELTDRAILHAATRSVTLTSCGSDRTGYAGGILFQHPTCVRIRISADREGTTRHREILIPFGASCKA